MAIPTVALTTFIYGQLLNLGLWNEDKDEAEEEFEEQEEGSPAEAEQQTGQLPPLYVSLLPLLVALVLIALGAFAQAVGLESGLIAFFGDPFVALFLGLLGAYLLAWRTLSNEQVEKALSDGFDATGQILVITGIGGSLAAVIGATGLEDILKGFFSADTSTPLLLAWLVAAVLHVAIGSISVAAITAAGILAPIVGNLDIPTVWIALAIGSGALFVMHVNSNFFWMFQTVLGIRTTGSFKTLSLVTGIASVVSMLIILALNLVL